MHQLLCRLAGNFVPEISADPLRISMLDSRGVLTFFTVFLSVRRYDSSKVNDIGLAGDKDIRYTRTLGIHIH